MKFSYKKYKNNLRPVIPIEISHGSNSLRYEVLVDSGADICLFHAEVAEYLGIDLKKAKKDVVMGVGGKSVQYYFAKVAIVVGGWKYDIDAGFLPDVGGRVAPYGIVGQQGFFEHFSIAFDWQKEVIEIKRK